MASVRLRIGETRNVQVAHAPRRTPKVKSANVHLPVTWESSDDDTVAVVSSTLMNLDGHADSVTGVKGVTAGTATITATVEGSDPTTLDVTVTPESNDPLVIQLLDAEKE